MKKKSLSMWTAVHHLDFPTVLDALEINNPVVANCLIDLRGIEKILLIKAILWCFGNLQEYQKPDQEPEEVYADD
ncbi:structural maintenance of chromosomes protein 6-like [Heptranchias perlo]|uniref:structural maintenance of chromosomes protein 6-like n=1 Tax=Heptranchias perlo TaxID=212740 RepID=UPI003559E2DE